MNGPRETPETHHHARRCRFICLPYAHVIGFFSSGFYELTDFDRVTDMLCVLFGARDSSGEYGLILTIVEDSCQSFFVCVCLFVVTLDF